jgi:hypothetical protein
MNRILVLRIVLLAVLVASVAAGALKSASTARAEAPSACRCPLIYAPVVCDKGRQYPNQCVADCHHATNCVPSGG